MQSFLLNFPRDSNVTEKTEKKGTVLNKFVWLTFSCETITFDRWNNACFLFVARTLLGLVWPVTGVVWWLMWANVSKLYNGHYSNTKHITLTMLYN